MNQDWTSNSCFLCGVRTEERDWEMVGYLKFIHDRERFGATSRSRSAYLSYLDDFLRTGVRIEGCHFFNQLGYAVEETNQSTESVPYR